MRAILLPAMSVLLIGACDPSADVTPLEADTPPVEAAVSAELAQAEPTAPIADEGAPVAERKTATIDWSAARADYAARDGDETGMFEVASGGSPAVPILLPDEPVGIASTGDDALQFRPLADGYFAVKKGEVYDMIINGTDRLVVRGGDAGAAIDTALEFEETMTGAQVSFSRYGASYLVEFMCKDPATAIRGSCVTEEDAVAEVETLLIAGTR
ncbi:MAG: hypothetical protein AAFR51_07810 [Pseudomonadota bacterium]